MLQKAIENWLTNTNERRYQLPFVQVLIAEGHTIKYVSKHGQLEQGKDIISIDASGTVWAFQLKTGNIDLPEWRKIRGEICELAELSPVHASIPIGTSFRAVLVTNGTITDPVRQQIVQINQENEVKHRQVAHIETEELNALISRFLKAQGDFIPTQPVDADKFLRFYLASGHEFFDKELFQEFILGSCLSDAIKAGTEASHAVTSSIIMTSYLLKNYQEKKNHLAVFEAWISLLGYICRFAAKKQMPKEMIDAIGELVLEESINEIRQLEEEVLARPFDQAFLEGKMFGDGALIYQARATIVLGVLGAYHAYLNTHNIKDESKDKVNELLNKNMDKLWFWGESAFPYLYWIFRFCENNGAPEVATGLLLGMVDSVIAASSNNELWLPSPYVTAENAIRKNYRMIPLVEESEVETKSVGSYVIKSLVEIIARRGRREILGPRWRWITHIFMLEFIPDEIYDRFLWRTENGKNDSRPFENTQSWNKLVEQTTDRKEMPVFQFRCAEDMMPFFILISPHRATANIIKKFEIVVQGQ